MILQEIQLFEGIDPAIMNEIVNICSEENYPQNTVLFKMGEEAECLYILEEGIVKLVIKKWRNNNLYFRGIGRGIWMVKSC